MRAAVVLGLAAAAGCTVWSKRYDRFDVAFDGPGAVAVSVEGASGPIRVFDPGDEATSTGLRFGRHDVTFTRAVDAGVRVACDTCLGPMILVGPNGRAFGTYSARSATIVEGEPVVLRRPYYLARVHEWSREPDWAGSSAWYRSTEEGVLVSMTADWARVRHIEAFQRPARGWGWLLVGVSSMAAPLGLVMLGERDRLVPALALLSGTTFAAWSGWRTALRPARRTTLHEARAAGR